MPRVSPIPNELEVLLEETTFTKKVLQDPNVKDVLGLDTLTIKNASKTLSLLGQPVKKTQNYLTINKKIRD